MKIVLPSKLKEILGNGIWEQRLSLCVDKVAPIFDDNTLHFFPAYTDHGAIHINSTLDTIAKLIPENVWENEVLTCQDAFVICSATILHDIAMHLYPAGFEYLLNSESVYKPINWFVEKSGESTWSEEWKRFVVEIARMSERAFQALFGKDSYQSDAHILNHCAAVDLNQLDILIVGEFIRRFHARMAHEFVVMGFPTAGKPIDIFPNVGNSMTDIVGIVARSHGLPIRTAASYLEDRFSGELRPEDLCPVFHMALLRIADYLQMDKSRAPIVLLSLKDPQSPISIDEWNKHHGIERLSFTNTDPKSIKIVTTVQNS